MIDQTSEMCVYWAAVSACAASAKYANVTSPVSAMPIDRIRAPRPYDDRGGATLTLEADKQHGPRERRARLHDVAVAGQQRDEAALGPVVRGPGGVAELLEVRPARHVQPPPEGLARHRDEQMAVGDARHLGDRVRRVG